MPFALRFEMLAAVDVAILYFIICLIDLLFIHLFPSGF